MRNIAKQSFGFVITFSGSIDAPEMHEWVIESRRQLATALPTVWGVVVDMRELQPLPAEVQAVMVEGQRL